MGIHPEAGEEGDSDKAKGDVAGNGNERAQGGKPGQWLDDVSHVNSNGMTDAAVQQESDQAQAPVLSGFLKLKGKNNPARKGQKYLQRVIFTLIARHTAAMGQQTR